MTSILVRPPAEAARDSTAHAAGSATIAALLAALRAGDAIGMGSLCDRTATASTSHRGALAGADALAGLFGPFVEGQRFELTASNVYLAGAVTTARASAYLAGALTSKARLAFGAVMIVDLARDEGDTPWRVTALKLQLTWIEGETALRPGWTFPRFDKAWTVGDALPVIVSEIDAPWHVYPENLLRANETREVADTYARYSWGIDQADFGLLTGCYTEDAAGTFRPMGALSGRRAIIGVLKDFRRAWPMMQHHGEVLGNLIAGDRAAIVVGRIIPQAARPANVYGAYYPMRLRRDGALWRIIWTEYRPGWFSREELALDTLLAATLSGEGDWLE